MKITNTVTMKRALKIIAIIISCLCIVMLGGVIYYFSVTHNVRLQADKLQLSTSCVQIFDKDGREISEEHRSSIPLSELPSHLPNAFVAVEDKRFYTHGGLDYKRICKALLKNIATFSFREGASTISQQLIKNTHLSGEKTINRKLKEFKLTRILERNYSKEQILELYLNSIYFGHNAFGISDAALFYFGKNASELSPAESATVAALVKSPNRYSPFKDGEKCLTRRNFVLKLMTEQGYITQAQYSAAVDEPLPTSPTPKNAKNSYLSKVLEELTEHFPDYKVSDLRALKVYTFYDPALQAELEKTDTGSDVCVLVRDNATHGIKALYSTAGTPARLPASLIKPLLVFAPAVEENIISPATPLLDEKTDFGGYCPSNYGGKCSGYMSARYALSHSVNIPAVKVLSTLGCEKAAHYLDKMDLHVEKDDYSLALALGGMKKGFPLTALADGYATFANGGTYAASSTISYVTEDSGKEIYRFTPSQKKVFSEDTAFLINDMLKSTVKEGTAKRLSVLPFELCAKTGTGGTAAGNTDAYTVSYTPNDTVAVWVGNADNSPVETTGGGIPCNVALRINRFLYQTGAPQSFLKCEGVEEVSFDRMEYENNHRIVLSDPLAPPYSDLTELFRKSAIPSGVSTRYSSPRIEQPQIFVQNGAVKIVLCHAEYYDYEIKRENNGVSTLIYSGKYRESITDNSVCGGTQYTYTVTPLYKDTRGTPVILPSVRIGESKTPPDSWWE